MKASATRLNVAALSCILSALIVFTCSCSSPRPAYRVALVGFEGGELGEERNALADYGKRRVEAELGVDVDFIMPGSGDEMQSLFLSGENGYDLVLSLGQSSSLDMLFARPADVQVQAAALDFEISQPVPGEDAVSLIRYRVEEGSYICGFLAGWLTSRGGHPLTNTLPLAAFIGALDDPLEPYYDGGFSKGVKTAAPTGGTHRYFIKTGGDSAQARAYAEDAIKKGVDIIFCTPGTFNGEVIKVAEEKNVLVILVGADRSGESPKHVLTSLILRDDNAVFNAVSKALSGDLKPGKQVWGIGEGTWSLAPFHEHDNYIRKDLKEALRQEEEKVSGIDFSS